ncbi:alpha/beta hydrolase [Sorangium sp. So ce375]|uniref:alpha/beta fold hydrolase n=1 Tax=Sorangium sp. So ce375 TaxID=3133306 RepID=UPI003F5BBFC6
MGKRVRRHGTAGSCAGRPLSVAGWYVPRSGRREKNLPISTGAAERRAARAEGRGREIRVGSEIVYVTETGSGKPAVLLPSMLIGGTPYQPAVEAMARRARVLVLELPGSGRGSRLGAPWTLERYARCVAGALRALRLERVTLIGHSLSGAVALVAAARYPERISGLVLVDSIGFDPPGSVLAIVLVRAADALRSPRFIAWGVPALLHNLLFHTRSALSLLRIAATADLCRYAARVRVRTLLAWGARDLTAPLGSALALQRSMPDSTLVVSPKGSHNWIVERPAEFADAVAGFMDRSG